MSIQEPEEIWPWTRIAAIDVALSFAALVAVLNVFARFLSWVELRPGVVLPDPVLALLQPRDLTWVTFSILHSAIMVTAVALLRHPRALALGLRSYVLMILLRMVAMALVPLEPPPGMIALQDPFIQQLGTHGQVLTRDLFFSGHTATMSILTLNARTPRLRAVMLACTVAVAGCVVWQAVHYTIDALAAPFFAYAAYRIALLTAPARQQDPAPAARAVRSARAALANLWRSWES
jgi:hypothetical protein